jgi:hypothetical protein
MQRDTPYMLDFFSETTWLMFTNGWGILHVAQNNFITK